MDVMFSDEILNKYNVPAPRYTSYPPANFFTEKFTGEDYRAAVEASNGDTPEHISIYIHIPFCRRMCFYCGCNSVRVQSRESVAAYIDALKKEIRMTLPLWDRGRLVSQIHYGGGSPSSLPIGTLREINDMVFSEFGCIDDPEIAIECHPGYLDRNYWETLPSAGFNRVSLGVQDFDEEVLKASNRRPSKIGVDRIVETLKSAGVSVNMDFIFGLPRQTPRSFSETIRKAAEMNPDRLVTFSYAHVPWVNKLQLQLEKAGLPPAQDKDKMISEAARILDEHGYKAIGLDHFVRPDDELYKALSSGSLHRNFQGYCTRRTTGQVYAFGITGISQLSAAYSQNTKDIGKYIAKVNAGEFPVSRGYSLDGTQHVAREVITRLMCNYALDWNVLAGELAMSAEEVKAAVNYDEAALAELAADGIIEYDDGYLKVRPEAKPFVRNVAAALDRLMVGTDKKFSKTI